LQISTEPEGFALERTQATVTAEISWFSSANLSALKGGFKFFFHPVMSSVFSPNKKKKERRNEETRKEKFTKEYHFLVLLTTFYFNIFDDLSFSTQLVNFGNCYGLGGQTHAGV
jgi:hypothetical protein